MERGDASRDAAGVALGVASAAVADGGAADGAAAGSALEAVPPSIKERPEELGARLPPRRCPRPGAGDARLAASCRAISSLRSSSWRNVTKSAASFRTARSILSTVLADPDHRDASEARCSH